MNRLTTCLIVEDDEKVQNYLVRVVSGEGYNCLACGLAEQAVEIVASNKVNIVLLDLGLPDSDGLEVIKELRKKSDVPIIVVSARDQDDVKVEALEWGADDYLTKPFSASELLARIKVSLRHHYRSVTPTALVRVGELSIDLDGHIVKRNEESLHLTPLEYNLLALLAKNVGKVCTASHILREVWGEGYGSDTQVLRAVMAGLRRKIEKNPAMPQYILTEIGVGYRLSEE